MLLNYVSMVMISPFALITLKLCMLGWAPATGDSGQWNNVVAKTDDRLRTL